VHDHFGRPAVFHNNACYRLFGQVGKELAIFAQYDATTGRTTRTSSMVQTSTTALDVVSYRYNQAGELTATDDLQDNHRPRHPVLYLRLFQRLTAVWTDTVGITGASVRSALDRDGFPYMLLVRGFAAAWFAQITQVRSPFAPAHDVLESLRAEGMPMYSEGRP
jgi:hypothetical protein